MKVVLIGGGEGTGVTAAGLAVSDIPDLEVTILTSHWDNDDERFRKTSTGRLRKKSNFNLGHYGDTARIVRGLRAAFFGDTDWLVDTSAVRFGAGIGPGKSFAELMGDALGGTLGAALKNPSSRDKAIPVVRKALNVDGGHDDVLRKLGADVLDHLLEQDDFPRHSFANVLLFELERMAKERGLGPEDALKAMHGMYRIPKNFRITLVTWQPLDLKAKMVSGDTLEGQFRVDYRDCVPGFKQFDAVDKFLIDPPSVRASEEATSALLAADAIILSCGSFSNIAAAFAIEPMKDALQERIRMTEQANGSALPVIYVNNLMSKKGEVLSHQTQTVDAVVGWIHKAIGWRPSCIIYDDTDIPSDVLKRCRPEKKIKLGRLRSYETSSRFERPLVFRRKVAKIVDEDPNAPPEIRHDWKKLGPVLGEVLSDIMVGTLV